MSTRLLNCAILLFAITRVLPAQSGGSDHEMQGMAHMSGHMYMTTLRPKQPGDQAKADAIVTAAKAAMAPYEDYRKALADGYRIFLPKFPQPMYHFTKAANGLAAWSHFDPLKPTSLLYRKTPDGGYKLIGVMYTDRVDANEDEINEPHPAQHCALASAHQFLQGAGGTEGRILRSQCKVRPARLHPYAGSLRCRRRSLSSPRLRLDGPRVSL